MRRVPKHAGGSGAAGTGGRRGFAQAPAAEPERLLQSSGIFPWSEGFPSQQEDFSGGGRCSGSGRAQTGGRATSPPAASEQKTWLGETE